MKAFLIFCGALVALTLTLFIGARLVLPPQTFPVPYTLSIERGQTLFSVSNELYTAGALRSRRAFEILMLSLGDEKAVSHGDYYFERPVTVIELALRISDRNFGIDRAQVTFPEGFTNKQMADRLERELSDFDSAEFLRLAEKKEGYLFPDTYIFFPWTTPAQVVEKLEKTFSEKTAPLADELVSSGRTLEDIVIMASLIEKEARGEEDRYLISGILWKRIDKGMPLQVDAPFLYLLGKESSELTRTDLNIDSPFNTYRYKGLPPNAIGNPGIGSIQAALRPKASLYLYYLHDNDGMIYYGRTYQEHLQNIRKHLR